jgi:hypothetical protein
MSEEENQEEIDNEFIEKMKNEEKILENELKQDDTLEKEYQEELNKGTKEGGEEEEFLNPKFYKANKMIFESKFEKSKEILKDFEDFCPIR